MRRFIVMLLILVFSALPAWGVERSNTDISETNGFIVEVEQDTVFIKNVTGSDAFNVYILIYRTDVKKSNIEWDMNSQARQYIYTSAMPDGLWYKIRNPNIFVGHAYKARVYYLKEYKGL